MILATGLIKVRILFLKMSVLLDEKTRLPLNNSQSDEFIFENVMLGTDNWIILER